MANSGSYERIDVSILIYQFEKSATRRAIKKWTHSTPIFEYD